MINKTLLFLLLTFISSVAFGKSDSILQRSDSGVYFIHENETINHGKYYLSNSIRSIDKMDIDTSTIEIKADGEGWLDKDSVPVGNWKFYANSKAGNKYILKEGNYVRSSPSMFFLLGDTDELKDVFGSNLDTLLMQQIRTIPFIKAGTWTYHPNGKLWKKVTFRSSEIPIKFFIAEINGGEQLLFPVNDDEPIEGKVKEFNAEGKLYKELYYMGFNKVFRKISYDKNGNKTIKESFSESDEISPTIF